MEVIGDPQALKTHPLGVARLRQQLLGWVLLGRKKQPNPHP
jgi:hypothetical protein